MFTDLPIPIANLSALAPALEAIEPWHMAQKQSRGCGTISRDVVRVILWAIIAVLTAAGCSGGTLGVEDRPDADTSCPDGSCDEPVDPCAAIDCPAGQSCVDGRCRTTDLCQGVECSNPGEVCDPRDGACHSGAADDDGDGYTIAAGDCDDGVVEVNPGATELCNGVDDDCDFEVDEGYPDSDGDGFDTCGFGNPAQADCDDREPMSHPGRSEECDGIDNDCDGETDEGLSPRPCETACGSGEDRCEGGRWVCSAPQSCECTPAGAVEEESCGNCGVHTRVCDSDLRWSAWGPCTGEGLCAVGAVNTEDCGNCGERSRSCTATCGWSAWGACTGEGPCAPPSTQPCTTTCGSTGSQSCTPSTCTWGSCMLPTESCNGVDDDCDGEVDEGFRVERIITTFSALSAHHPGCYDTADAWYSVECHTAIHRFCESRPCFTTGYGPVARSGDTAHVVCVAGATLRSIGYSDLSPHNYHCDGTDDGIEDGTVGRWCTNAIKRWCDEAGFVSGFGPFETSGLSTEIACVGAATNLRTSWTVLSSFHSFCDGVSSYWGAGCHSAIHHFCQDAGYASGFGTIESNIPEDIAWVTCLAL
jgi:hypothetical protein